VPTFVVLLNWTEKGIKNYKDSPSRADAFAGVMEKLGGKLKETYWTLGPYDVVGVVEAPDEESVTAAMLELGSRGNTRSTTMRAYTRSEFEGVAAKTG
jgi:uncharacterized protein with GYD domain